ncbi:uncharacterized protein [Amphiura filiformis]|uniref:uncharacterized protein n=1 Tax=Amphiura filiformis TaxID=82378 RepID=UPI003B2266BC
MSGFLVQDSIRVLTQNGECQIDLCLGDITKLKRKDKVDVIVVSAFTNDYVPTRTSVIGALKYNLGLDVGELSRNKAEDLRKLYSCWWSHRLPDQMPYGRLLCFETNFRSQRRPQEMVANVFRCLVPILNNEDGTVITPLLNTGDQGYGQIGMLQGMVVAAVNWMKAGLPLRLLKIVLYAKSIDGPVHQSSFANSRYGDVCGKFAELKEKYDSQYLVPKAVPIEFDIYLSYSEDDQGVVATIQDGLKSIKSDVRIYGNKQKIDSEAVWQQDMYQVMIRSARVVTVLSPHYLKSTACVEQYNIALCCNRRAHRDMLAPIYVNSIDLMPTYMGLVQYVDCRPNDNKKIEEACKALIVSMTIKVHLETLVVDPAPIQYDIFLSYSHRDDEQAYYIVELLRKLHPKLRVFFDLQELKTGKSWQRTLYHSIDGSRCLLALISENYIKSPVCQEEYNLALAKHCSMDGSLKLIPLCLEDLKEVPVTFGKVKMVRATPDVFHSVSNAVCKAVVNWLDGKEVHAEVEEILTPDQNLSCDMDKVSESQRRTKFISKYGTENKKLLSLEKRFPAKLKDLIQSRPGSAMSKCGDNPEGVDVVLSCAPEDWKYASFLRAVLTDAAPNLAVKSGIKSEKERLTLMDTARCVVAFVTPSYLDSPEQVEEFHIALCRQRTSPSTVLFPITVHPVPPKPTYFRLVPCSVSIADAMWSELAHKWHVDVPSFRPLLSDTSEIVLPPEVMLGLHEAAGVLINELKQDEERSGAATSDVPFSRPVLHNIIKIRDDIADDAKDHGAVVEITELLVTLKMTDEDFGATVDTQTGQKPPLQNDPELSPEETTVDSKSDKPVTKELEQNGEAAKLDEQNSPSIEERTDGIESGATVDTQAANEPPLQNDPEETTEDSKSDKPVTKESNQNGEAAKSDGQHSSSMEERMDDHNSHNDHGQSSDDHKAHTNHGTSGQISDSQASREVKSESSEKVGGQERSQRPNSGVCLLI